MAFGVRGIQKCKKVYQILRWVMSRLASLDIGWPNFWYQQMSKQGLRRTTILANANTIASNVAKTEVILFKTKHETCNTDLRFMLCRKGLWNKIWEISRNKKINEKLNWKIHDDIASKLNKANAVAKLRHFVNSGIFRSTYFAIFHSHLDYVCIAKELARFLLQKACVLQKSTKNY